MARTFAEETVELSNTVGTGAYTLEGPKGNYFPFSASYATGDKPVYVVRNRLNTKSEYNRAAALTIGPPDTLARGVWKSTNGNAAVSWTSDDLPLTITVPSSAELHEGVVTGWLAAARHALIRAGAMFFTSADVAVSWRHKLATGDATDTGVGTYVVAKDAYFPDGRRQWEDVGAANLALDADDIGKVLAFNCSAQRTATLPASATAKHGYSFEVIAYGSATYGVTLTPDGSDAIDQAKVPPGGRARVEWDGARNSWRVHAVTQAVPKMHIYGLTYANNGSDATNDIDVAAGGCMSDDGTDWIEIAATTKQLDVAAAADNGATPSGMLGPAAAIGNNDYALYAIKNPATGETRVFAEKQDTAPTLPTGFTKKRQFGWIKRAAGAIVPFKTYERAGGGLELAWDSPTVDVTLSNTLTTARRTDPVKVPLTFSTVARVRIYVNDAGSSFYAIFGSPDETDAAPSSGAAAPLSTLNAGANIGYFLTLDIRTSATGTIAARATIATVDTYNVATLGFIWSRR